MAESSGEKTEEPTHKRLTDARKKGQVAMSRDMTAAAVFIALFMVLSLSAESWVGGLLAHMKTALEMATSEPTVVPQLKRGLAAMKDALMAPLISAVVAAIGLGFLQTGGLFAFEALKPDPQKLMPDLKRVVSTQSLVEMVKGFVKITLAGAVAYAAMEPLMRSLTQLSGASPRELLVLLGHASGRLGQWMVLVVVAVGFGDFLWQRHKYMKDMRMSREEVKREYKEQEGDPHHKQERMRLHKELLQQRMLNQVRKADFVVVNPDHIAVAIRYDKDSQEAPVVVAKGERILAQKIKEIARESGVPIFRDVSLARALRDVEEGDEIPEALYEAVAEILRVVYSGSSPSSAAAPPVARSEEAAEPEKPPPAGPMGWHRA
jgi:flagellar biosynthesis protein FlhB